VTFVADECVLASIIERLRASGHTVHAIREVSGGIADPDVLAIAVKQQAVLLTQDKDFGELVFRLKLEHCGIVLIRLAGMTIAERAELVANVIAKHESELPRAFTVISSSGVRIRPAGTAL
jgi:predicted nuclease of predicted toxin-antitoxin system